MFKRKRPSSSSCLDESWKGLGETILKLGSLLGGQSGKKNEILRAEAFRYLAGQTAVSTLQHVGLGDSEAPVLFRSQGIGFKWGFSNPDTYYISATLREDLEYRLWGRLGNCNQTIIGTYSGGTSDAKAGQRITGAEIETDKDGNFELFIGRNPRSGNWIQIIDGVDTLAIYQVFSDWNREQKGCFAIETVSTNPSNLTEVEISERLNAAATDMSFKVKDWISVGKKLALIPANRCSSPREIQLAHLGTFFTVGKWKLQPHEALIIEATDSDDSPYWGWCLYNPWSETLDFENSQGSLNKSQADLGPKGIIQIVISERDPGVQNWLDCSGHPEGYFAWRITSMVKPTKPVCRVVPLESVANELASSTKIDPENREKTIRERRRSLAMRLAP